VVWAIWPSRMLEDRWSTGMGAWTMDYGHRRSWPRQPFKGPLAILCRVYSACFSTGCCPVPASGCSFISSFHVVSEICLFFLDHLSW
jgi:hypothetical protein